MLQILIYSILRALFSGSDDQLGSPEESEKLRLEIRSTEIEREKEDLTNIFL